MLTLTIKPKQPTHPTARPRKSRSFAATLLGYVVASDLYDERESKTTERPLRLSVAGRDTELNPFISNLVSEGRQAEFGNLPESPRWERPTRVECLRSLEYATVWQRHWGSAGATAAQVYIRSLCEPVLPQADAPDVRFVCHVPTRWADERLQQEVLADPARCQQIVSHAAALGILEDSNSSLLPLPLKLRADELLQLVPLATYFARFVDSRTDVPLLPEPAFFLQLYLAALQAGIASLSQTEVSRRSYTREDKADRWFFARRRDLLGFIEYGLPDLGLLPGVAVWCSHAELGRFVTEQISLYYAAKDVIPIAYS